MGVLNGRKDGLFAGEVAVVPAAFLPEPKDPPARPFTHHELLQSRIASLLQHPFDAIGVRPFDGGQKGCDSRSFIRRENDEVDVLRHVHETEQAKPLSRDGSVNRPGQETLETIVFQKGKSTITREG